MLHIGRDSNLIRYIIIGVMLTGLLCAVCALILSTNQKNVIEEKPIEQLIEEYWHKYYEEQQLLTQNELFENKNEKENDLTLTKPVTTNIPKLEEVELNEMINEDANQVMNLKSDERIETKTNKININTAGIEELQQLKGIGPSKAKAIVLDRETKGAYKQIEDIKRVKGIGEKLYAGIKESIVAEP